MEDLIDVEKLIGEFRQDDGFIYIPPDEQVVWLSKLRRLGSERTNFQELAIKQTEGLDHQARLKVEIKKRLEAENERLRDGMSKLLELIPVDKSEADEIVRIALEDKT